mmetsp:Transcript_17182/g.22340  ORF Transcript_17182/g.22340 Transcript_17182/m.22340 type:complete len:155 (+) Transcript_17182:34-498(+)
MVFLAGSWEGEGLVLPKGIKYKEKAEFRLLKEKPILLNWQQFTQNPENGMPMHAENGFLKVLPSGEAELLLSHPFSANEIYRSVQLDSTSLTCEDCQIQRGPLAKGKFTTYVKRVYRLDDDGNTLNYDLYLGVDNNEPYHHLKAKLTRSSQPSS